MSLRSRIVAAGSVVAAVTALAAAGPAAAAAAPEYVALGDSYSSGVGTGTFIDDGTSCQRSVYAYPSLLAAAGGYQLNFRACSGARVPDVQNNQIDALGAGTRYVSISVGGNDAGFADVLTECAQPGWMSDCNGAIDGAQSIINNTLPGSLAGLYGSIRARATGASVVVVGYPRLFNGEDCNAGTWFSPAEEARLNATADLLNSRIADAAAAAGFDYVNPTSAFVGHAVCGDPEWLNGLSWPISESYHPNRAGHAQGYVPLVGPELSGSPVTVDATVLATATASAGTLADRQRPYADRDAAIMPKDFVKPDLNTPRARAAAARAGVDLASRASIDAVDAAWDAAEAKAAGYLDRTVADAKDLAGRAKDGALAAGRTLAGAGAVALSTVGSWGSRAWHSFGG